MSARRLSTVEATAYGLPNLALAFAGLPVVVYLPVFYSETIGLSLMVVGITLFAARLFDIVTDIYIGTLSDRLLSLGLGRKILILCGAPVLMTGIWFLFNAGTSAGVFYLLGWSLVTWSGWSLMAVPYTAWGSELGDYGHEKSRAVIYREGFGVLGVASFIAGPTLYGIADDPAAVLAFGSTLLMIAIPATAVLALLFAPEQAGKTQPIDDTPVPGKILSELAKRYRSTPSAQRRVFLAYILSNIANALPASLFLFYIRDVLLEESRVGLFLGLYFLAGIAGLPVWLWISNHIGKSAGWMIAMAIASLSFLVVPFLPAHSVVAFAVICCLTGMAQVADLALPASIQADFVERNRQHGKSGRAGFVFGLWSLATKFATALGVLIALSALTLAGYEPTGVSDEHSLLMLALLYGFIPVLFKFAALCVLWQTRNALHQTLMTSPNRNNQRVEHENIMHNRTAFRAADRRL